MYGPKGYGHLGIRVKAARVHNNFKLIPTPRVRDAIMLVKIKGITVDSI